MDKINFRALGVGDLTHLLDLFSQFKDSNRDVDIRELVSDPKCHCVIAELNDKVIGFGALVRYNSPSKGEVGRIEDVVIDEKEYEEMEFVVVDWRCCCCVLSLF